LNPVSALAVPRALGVQLADLRNSKPRPAMLPRALGGEEL
jgi:hypothetical protein